MNNAVRFPAAAAVGPFAALQAQARRAPRAEALRSRRRGQWRAWSWQRLAAQAELAARGWAALGVRQGDPIVALCPLGAELIAALFAADALGATIVLADNAAEEQVIAGARFALADGTHELERLLRHRGPHLSVVVVNDASVVPDSGEVDQVPVLGRVQWLERAATHELPVSGTGRFPIAQVLGRAGPVWLSRSPQATAAAVGGADRVFADFAPTWLPGLEFLLHAWPIAASLLLIPEPQGDGLADQRAARANIWLAPVERLSAVVASLNARLPAHGFGAWAARTALAGHGSWVGALVRARIRAGMGFAATRDTLSDAVLPEPTQRWLVALGIAPAAAAAADEARAGATAPGRVLELTRWAAS